MLVSFVKFYEMEKKMEKLMFPKTKKIGFTLIELLVVIAIISLLVSILLPSLKKAQDLAKQVTCQSNMRNFGLGTCMYANDYDGIFPYFMHDSRPPYDYGTLWLNTLAGYTGMTEGKDDLTNLTSPQRQCPGDENVWIAVNYGAWLNDKAPFVYKVDIRGNNWPGVQIESIKQPTEWVAFMDSHGNHYVNTPAQWLLDGDFDGDGSVDSNISTLNGWIGEYNGAAAKVHNNGMNVTMCDGRSQWLSFDEWQDPDMPLFIDK